MILLNLRGRGPRNAEKGTTLKMLWSPACPTTKCGGRPKLLLRPAKARDILILAIGDGRGGGVRRQGPGGQRSVGVQGMVISVSRTQPPLTPP
jgi:hypothetical protein